MLFRSTNHGITYAMYDIEEQVLKHPDIVEAEVIKFKIDGEEYPAVVVVLRSNAIGRVSNITKELCNISVSGIEYLIGVRYVNKFETNSVTSKRDYLVLKNNTTGYYCADLEGNLYRIDVGMERKVIHESEILIENV